MLVRLNAAKCIGIEAVNVKVEVDIASGIGIHIVGLVDVAVKESLLRTVTALQAVGYKIPGKKIVINLSVYLLCESIGKLTNCQLPTY